MKNKKQLLIIFALCLTCAIGVYAATETIHKNEALNTEEQMNDLKDENISAVHIIKNETDEKFAEEDMEAYAYFLAELYPSDDEIQYIDALIKRGYRVKDLVEIFVYWQDTQEDLNIIEKVYAYRPPVDGVLYWVDSAFIKLAEKGETKGNYAGLTVEEVREYQQKGLSYEEILTADKLSRYGTKEVKTILEDKQADVSWYEIMDDVYGLCPPEEREANIAKYKNIENPEEIFASMKLAELNETSLSAALDGVLDNESSVSRLTQKKIERKAQVAESLQMDEPSIETVTQ